MRRAERFEKGAKLPLDFTHRIRYNKYRSKNDAPVCRNGRRGGLKIPCANNTCGFDPHHRHKKETLQLVWRVSFLSAACEWVEQHGPALQGERSALRAVAQCAGDPHHRHPPSSLSGGFPFYLRRVRGSNSTALPCRASDQPCGLSLSARETPTTGTLSQLVWGSFLFICGV